MSLKLVVRHNSSGCYVTQQNRENIYLLPNGKLIDTNIDGYNHKYYFDNDKDARLAIKKFNKKPSPDLILLRNEVESLRSQFDTLLKRVDVILEKL